MSDEIHVVLLLDVAEQNPIGEAVVVSQLPPGARPPIVLRLTDFEPTQHGTGSPARWLRTMSAIDRMLRAARTQEREGRCRYWVAGRAGLPAFFYLGYRLTKKAAVTLVNPRDAGPPDVLPLDAMAAPGEVTAPRYFACSPWPARPSVSAVSLGWIVSSRIRVSPEQVEEVLSRSGTPPAAIVEAQAGSWLDMTTVASAVRELDDQVAAIATWYPRCAALSVFVAGPATLAFLAGRAINPHIFPDVRVFQHREHQYELAYETRSHRNKHPILFLASNPPRTTQLALAEETREIQRELDLSKHGDRFELHPQLAPHAMELRALLQKFQPTVVHFSGHGEASGLLFHHDADTSRIVPPEDLCALFRIAGAPVKVAVLNACYSEGQADTLLEVVDCVVGIPGPVPDDSARAFAAAFYRALGDRESLQTAFDLGCTAIRIHEAPTGDRSTAGTRDICPDGRSDSGERRGPPTLRVRPGVDASTMILAAGSA